ncbi:MAG: molybdopterin molybdenumtransferase MoeA, partial [Alphaproteobacteria bacterium]
MLSVADALAQVLAPLQPTPVARRGLRQAAGLVLAAPVMAKRDQPPAALSAMDGYAVRASDVAQVPAVLDVVGAVAAGDAFAGRLRPGQAVRIFTGAPLPDGADAIVIQEDADALDGGRVRIRQASAPGRHVRARGY